MSTTDDDNDDNEDGNISLKSTIIKALSFISQLSQNVSCQCMFFLWLVIIICLFFSYCFSGNFLCLSLDSLYTYIKPAHKHLKRRKNIFFQKQTKNSPERYEFLKKKQNSLMMMIQNICVFIFSYSKQTKLLASFFPGNFFSIWKKNNVEICLLKSQQHSFLSTS